MTETAKYSIVGLVDKFDEQGNITGQYEIGSVQELTLNRGSACVDAGTCSLVEEAAELDATGEGDAVTTDESSEVDSTQDLDATDETGEASEDKSAEL